MTVAIDPRQIESSATISELPIDETPTQCVRRNRRLHQVYCPESPGAWRDDHVGYASPIMDIVEEAWQRDDVIGVCGMKSAQGWGTDIGINSMMYVKQKYGGQQCFVTSTDEFARKFGEERFANVIRDWPGLQSKRGDRDDSDYTFRFVDGAIDLCGGKSINNLESNPYAMIVFDEWDRIALNLLRDPIGLARSRSMSRAGRSLVYGWGHPTSKEIGVGQAYWNLSDRRRGFVIHAACGHEFYLQWDHVRDGAYYCPNCGSEIPDGERHAMSRRLVLKSSLPPEVAATRKWIGWHFSHLYYPHILVSEMWTDWLRCEGDDAATETFVNKRLGECHEAKKIVISPEALWKCIDKREPFMRGQVPRWVRFLTAGQDSRQMELHYAIWGWGLRRIDKETTMVSAALVDWGVVPRVKSETFYESEYHVFDKLIYDRTFDRGMKVWACGHDAGYAPTQIAIHTYCRCHQGRAFPTKGANLKHSSSSMAPYIRRGNALNIELKNGEILRDERQWILNTFTLKQDWYGWIGQERTLVDGRVAQMICLPTDVEAEFIKQSSSEYLTIGERNGELVWKHAGANHWADCNTIAQAMYLKDDRLQDRLTADEAQRANGPTRQWPSEREPVDRAAIGRGGGPEYG